MIPPAVEEFRKKYRSEEISSRYSGVAHFSFTTLGCLAVIGAAVWRVSAPTALEWVVVPGTFLFANLVEYLGHRGPMHHPVRLLRVVFQRHSLEHHRFYTHDAMALESTRDYKMVLFPPSLLIFFLGFHAIPVGWALHAWVSPNACWLFVAVALGYFLTYEWLHLAYHVGENSWVGRLWFVRVLRNLHMTHHDPAKMQKHNFNITFPICDAVFGTRYREGVAEGEKAQRG